MIQSGILNYGGFIDCLLVRIQGGDFEPITSAMAERWKKVVPTSPFSFNFVEQQYDDLYRSETRLSSIMNVFSALAIFIAGLGLFGLASYTIMQRTKELGIRKFGCFPFGIGDGGVGWLCETGAYRLLLRSPISWFVMNNWLENFAYPVGFNWIIVTGAGVAAIAVAMGTVLYHAIEAATVNPVQSLRSE